LISSAHHNSPMGVGEIAGGMVVVVVVVMAAVYAHAHIS
jgi:hypothetical protein